MKCINCFREIEDGIKFCPKCGFLQPEDREAYEREHPELADALPEDVIFNQFEDKKHLTQGFNNHAPCEHQAPSSKVRNKKRTFFWIIILAALVVLLLGSVIFLMLKQGQNKMNEQYVSKLVNLETGDSFYDFKQTEYIEDVVTDLGINIKYYSKIDNHEENIYKNSPVLIIPLRKIEIEFSITIVPKNETDFEYNIDGRKMWQKSRFGYTINTPGGPIAVIKTKIFNRQNEGYNYIAKVSSVGSAAKEYLNSIKVQKEDKNDNVFRLSVTTENKELSADILNALVIAYKQSKSEKITAIELNNYINSISEPGIELIPENTDIASIKIRIMEYNDNVLKYQKIASTASGENPVLYELRNTLTIQFQAIKHEINRYVLQLHANNEAEINN